MQLLTGQTRLAFGQSIVSMNLTRYRTIIKKPPSKVTPRTLDDAGYTNNKFLLTVAVSKLQLWSIELLLVGQLT